MNLTTGRRIILDMGGSTQKEILHTLTEIAFREEKTNDTDTFFQELCKRRQECITDFGKGIAIPHARHTYIEKAGILFVRMKHKIGWKSIDEESVEAAVCLLAPGDEHDSRLKASSKPVHRLMHEDFVDILKTAEEQQISGEIVDTVF